MYKSLRRTDAERTAAFAEIDRMRAEQKAELAKSDRQWTIGLVCYLIATILAYNFAPLGLAVIVLFTPAIGLTLIGAWAILENIVRSIVSRETF
tara:strand:- start:199 stop:480 length:282 start_codon:yes stop_codon:yes gene_type:complete